MRRKQDELLPLERRILAVAATGREEIHGFALARRLASEDEANRLIGYGTLYKALDRLRKEGFLESRWEDPDAAELAGRPRRRLYRITDAGRLAVESEERRAGSGEQLTPRRATP
ncbi:MAG: PadR family transcriptional regulator [Actinomycetota bacterium]|nr:PadR family transcriptional regulator [Actinomycetota bacterium]